MPGANGYLLDTHALLFFWGEPSRLSERALSILREPSNEVFVSAASAWEVATKTRIGKLPHGQRIVQEFNHRLAEDRFFYLSISGAHALCAGGLLSTHRDPFDRMLAAQSQLENLFLISGDTVMDELGAHRAW